MEPSPCKVDAVILAAGRSVRMGTDKLLYPLAGKPAIIRFLERFPFSLFNRVVTVVSERRIAALLAGRPLDCRLNENPGQGKSSSIRIGLAGCSAQDGIMFFVADQPLLSPSTITTLVTKFAENGRCIVVPTAGGKRQNPVLFPIDLVDELNALQGDTGGKEVIRRHPQRVLEIEFEDRLQFMDVDTVEAAAQVERIWTMRHN